VDGGGPRARERSAGTERAQSKRRLRHRIVFRQGRRTRSDGAWRAPARRGAGPAASGKESSWRHGLCDARAVRAREPAGACMHGFAAGGEARASRDRDPGPRSSHDRQGHQSAPQGRYRGEARRRASGGEALAGGLADSAGARTSARYAQARAVDRRQDRAPFRRKQMDHGRGRAPPRSSGARAQRHDPGRTRHLHGGSTEPRRAASRPRGALTAPGASHTRRGRGWLGNP
jgi:hypothetical protein